MPVFRVGSWLIDPERRRIDNGSVARTLEPRLFELLDYLAQRPGQVVDVEELLTAIWKGTFYGDGPVQRAVALLRKALDDDVRKPRYLQTIRKRGYRLIASVVWPDDYPRSIDARLDDASRSDPYVGLRSFASEESAMFFGRDRASGEALRALGLQWNAGTAFALIVGASGSGKSSLLAAGMMPLLLREEGFDGMQVASHAHLDLRGARSGDAVSLLAAALSCWRIDGWPLLPALDGPSLVEHVRTGQLAATIESALSRLPRMRNPAVARRCVALTIDHAEAIVADAADGSSGADAELQRLEDCLAALLASGAVAIVAVCRSDAYPQLLQCVPRIAQWKSPSGHVDLLPPGAGDIAEMIRKPAQRAGLRFDVETHTGLRLDDVLRDAAAANSLALPLLQHVLRVLYERRTDSGLLQMSTYRALGGLEGALASCAEDTLQGCSEQARGALPSLLSKLVTYRDDDVFVGIRQERWAALGDPAERALARALIDARLLVSDLADGTAHIALAHEALLREWPRAREWMRANLDWLAARSRIARAHRRWRESGARDDLLLGRGQPLEEARAALGSRCTTMTVELRAYVETSRRFDRARRRRSQLRLAMLAVAVAGLGLAIFLRGVSEQRLQLVQARSDRLADYLTRRLVDTVRPLGRLDVIEQVSAAALQNFGNTPALPATAAELIGRARALRLQAEVSIDRGDTSTARRRLSDAAQVLSLISPDGANRIALFSEQSRLAFWNGSIDFQAREFESSARCFGDYLRLAETLRSLQPDNSEWTLESSYAMNNLGTLAQARGRLADAAVLFTRSAALKREVLATRADDGDVRAELADTWSWLALVEDRRGHLQRALDFNQRQIDALRTLRGLQPDDVRWRHRIALGLVSRADLESAMGRHAALGHYTQALREFDGLTRHDPANRSWRGHAAYAHAQTAWLLMDNGRPQDAALHLRRASALIGPIDGAPMPTLRIAATVTLRAAQVAAQRGAWQQSAADAEASIASLRTVARQSPADSDAHALLAEALIAQGDASRALSDIDAATAHWKQASVELSAIAANSVDRRILVPRLLIARRLHDSATVVSTLAALDRSGHRVPAAFDPPSALTSPASTHLETNDGHRHP